jgi:hypothetical protein
MTYYGNSSRANVFRRKFEDTKEVIRCCKSKGRQCNGQKKKDKDRSTNLKVYPVLSSFMTYHRIYNRNNAMGATYWARTVYPSRTPEFTPDFSGVCLSVLFLLTIVLSVLWFMASDYPLLSSIFCYLWICPSRYSCYKSGDKSWMRKAPDCDFDSLLDY